MAAVAIRMPKLGMTMEEGTVVAWPVPLGARVEKGQLVLVIESEKNEAEIEATASGFLRHVYVPEGDVVPCGTLLAALTERSDEPFDAEAFAAAEARLAPVAPRPKLVARAAAVRAAPAARATDRKPIAPAARALAKRLGIDAGAVPGSGPGGRVTREDVEAFAATAAGHERVTEPVPPGVVLEVLREGQGAPLLLLPGFGTDVSSFAAQAPRLALRFHVLAVNPRGVGASDAPAEARYDVAQAAADAAAVLDAHADGLPAHLVGASLGAAVALELALARPECVRSLTLITPFTTATPRLLAVLDAWCRIGAETRPETLARVLAPWLFSDGLLADRAARERTLRGLAAACARIPAATLARAAAGLAAWSGTRDEDLAHVTVPTLVLAAGADLLTPAGEAVARAIPGAQCRVFPGARL